MVLDAIGQCIGDEGRAGVFRQRVSFGIEQPRAPEAVGALERRYGRGHLLKLAYVLWAQRIVVGHVVEDADEPGHDPAVAAGPEDALAAFLMLVEEGGVAVEEVLLGVVEE